MGCRDHPCAHRGGVHFLGCRPNHHGNHLCRQGQRREHFTRRFRQGIAESAESVPGTLSRGADRRVAKGLAAVGAGGSHSGRSAGAAGSLARLPCLRRTFGPGHTVAAGVSGGRRLLHGCVPVPAHVCRHFADGVRRTAERAARTGGTARRHRDFGVLHAGGIRPLCRTVRAGARSRLCAVSRRRLS